MDVDQPLSDGRVAPAVLSVDDVDLGLLSTRFVPDLFGERAEVFPGLFEGKRVATSLPRPDPRLEVDDQAGGRVELATLARGFHVSIIVTVIPGVPNDRRRLHEVKLTPEDVADLLPRQLGPALGPPMDVRVLPTIDTARFAWDDSRRQEFVDALRAEPPTFPKPPGSLVNEKVVDAYSKAIVASIYATYLDRFEGSHTVGWAPQVRPMGSAVEVSHEISADPDDGTGPTCLTRVHLPPELALIDPLAIMAPGARAMLLREVIRKD